MLFVEIIPAYLTAVVEMSDEFENWIKQGYNDKGWWMRICQAIKENDNL